MGRGGSSDVSAEPLRAYNLTVEGWHTYFVTANVDAAPVWVHNSCINGKTILSNGREIDVRISDQRIKHVLNGNKGPHGATGGHSTNSGSVKTIGNVEVGFGGVRRAQVKINGVLKSNNGGVSTLFPEAWSDQRILGEFAEGLRVGATSLVHGRQRVVSPSGVTIEYIRSGPNIVSFYPVFQ